MAADATTDPLVIRDLRFLGPMASASGWRPETTLPEIAFAGRSNVGKSSLLNKLVRRKTFARVSNTPGRTREINFFEVNKQFVLVDLPGYGYARVSKERRAEWRPLIEGYLRRSANLRGVVQLIDVRREPSDDDLQMLEFLSELGTPTIVAVTKIDKLTKADAGARVDELTMALGLDADQVIPFSAVTGVGRDELASAITSLMGAAGDTPTAE
jgi:GTP-binding protein